MLSGALKYSHGLVPIKLEISVNVKAFKLLSGSSGGCTGMKVEDLSHTKGGHET